MKRIEPPAAATWVLEHLTPADRDEALAGDLLEDYLTGRSDGWYWRQTLAAFAVAWGRYFAQRRSLLLFVLLWSMMAPAWTATVDGIERHAGFAGPIWRMDAPFSSLSTLGLWLLLHLAFLWAGIVVYFAGFARSRGTLRVKSMVRACGVASAVFLPVYFATFVLMNLIEFPGPMVDRSTLSPLGEVTDLRVWSLAVRVPYLITMLCAMWRATPRLVEHSRQAVALGGSDEEFMLPSGRAIAAAFDPFTLKRFFGFVVVTGLVNALIAAVLLCQLPESHHPTWRSLLWRAAGYVAFGGLAGIVGAWVYWDNPASPYREDPPMPFGRFALACASGWVWVPAMVILFEQVSAAAAVVAMAGAWALAVELRRVTAPLLGARRSYELIWHPEEREIFAESLYRAPWEVHGYLIAVCVYAGVWALFDRSNMTAGTLLAASAFVFAWKRTYARGGGRSSGYEGVRAARRLAGVAMAAVLVTAWALMQGVAHRNDLEAVHTILAQKESQAAAKAEKENGNGGGGYVSVVLWPPSEKKQIMAPVPPQNELLAPGMKRPVVVRFAGEYWYMQPPEQRPGPGAHQAHGTPLAEGIRASNGLPLVMRAHQGLGGQIKLSRCGEIAIEVMNRDNTPGRVAMSLVLTNSAVAGGLSVMLEERPVVSTEPEHFRVKEGAVFETLRFAVPARGRIRSFNEITVMMIADAGHAKVGPRIAIQQFQFIPR